MKFCYEYSLFFTDDGEVATGYSTGETPDEAAEFLGLMLQNNLKVQFKENPNRIISLVIQSSASEPTEGEPDV